MRPEDVVKKVLVVDDDRTLRRLVSETLSGDEYAVLQASDGAEGLDVARRERPQLVLLDVTMPRLDGMEVCRRLKTDPITEGITVVMLTGKSLDVDRQRGLALGATAYLSKPFSPLELLRLVDQLTKR